MASKYLEKLYYLNMSYVVRHLKINGLCSRWDCHVAVIAKPKAVAILAMMAYVCRLPLAGFAVPQKPFAFAKVLMSYT